VAAQQPTRPPELSELEAFALAVEEGSIAAAADRLQITGPAAAKRIRQLERFAGTPLETGVIFAADDLATTLSDRVATHACRGHIARRRDRASA